MSSNLTRCVYCLANPYAGELHLAGCPATTNVYPVREEDIPMACMACEQEFRIGEHFTYLRRRDGSLKVTCLGCAAHEVLLSDVVE